jgi:hypothetical protein
MLPVVRDIREVDKANKAMESLGYEAKGENGMAFRIYFQKGKNNRTHHVHVYQEADPEISRYLKFRDWMRSHASEAENYAKLKLELAKKFPHDILQYCNGKDAFVASIDAKDGFDGWRIVKALTDREWNAVRRLRQVYFFKSKEDPYTWTFTHKDHIHRNKDLDVERSIQNILLDHPQLLALVRKAFPHCQKLDGCTVLSGGALNTIYKIQIGQDAFALRIYARDRAHCKTEKAIHLLIDKSVSTPKLIYADESNEPWAYSIFEFVSGVHISEDVRVIQNFEKQRIKHYEELLEKICNVTILDSGPEYEHSFCNECYQKEVQTLIEKYKKISKPTTIAIANTIAMDGTMLT